jgi:hypothetical protein
LPECKAIKIKFKDKAISTGFSFYNQSKAAMKKIVLPILLTILTIPLIYGQNGIGVKLGVSSYNLPDDVLELEGKDLQISVENADYGIHFGIYGRIGLLGFHLQPEVNFNSNTVEYRLNELGSEGTVGEIRKEHYQNIDIPLLIMISPSIFRLYLGPVGHYFLHSTSELNNVDGLKQEFKTLKYGYQAGFGIELTGIGVDVRYEGNLSKFGDHITIDGNHYEFDSSPSRWLFSVTFKL